MRKDATGNGASYERHTKGTVLIHRALAFEVTESRVPLREHWLDQELARGPIVPWDAHVDSICMGNPTFSHVFHLFFIVAPTVSYDRGAPTRMCGWCQVATTWTRSTGRRLPY